MFITRFTLHRRAYQHPVVKAVEMMISDAFSKADNELLFPSKKPDQNPGQNTNIDWKSLSKSTECMDAYLWVTDDVLQQIRRIDVTPITNPDNRRELQDAQNIIDRIYRRDLYKLIGEKRVIWSNETESAQNGRYREEITERLKKTGVPSTLFEIEEAAFHYGNGQNNPMSDVNFYLKTKVDSDKKDVKQSIKYQLVDGKAMEENREISDMLPANFQQIYIRLYWKGRTSDDIENRKKIMDEFSKITEVKVGTANLMVTLTDVKKLQG